MKKPIHLISTILIAFCSLNSIAAIVPDKAPLKSLTSEQQIRLQQIDHRVTEIKSIDKSTLSMDDRKSLRTELRELKKEASGIASGGVFLSVGALLVVILLLILLL